MGEGGTGTSRCKDPEASVGLICVRDSEEARVAAAGEWLEGGQKNQDEGQGRA